MSDSAFSRRDVLKTTGTAVGAVSLVGTGAATFASEYETVVDIVDAGADPTGSEPVDDVVAEHTNDDTLVRFPEGRYVVNNLDFTDINNFAMVGEEGATLVPGSDYDPDLWIGGSGVEDFRFEGFTLDHTESGVHPSVGFSAWDGLVVRDVTKKGYHDGENTAFGFSIWRDSGSGLVENLEMPDGSEPETAVGVYVNTNGPLTFRDCHVEGFGNNGLYASNSAGPVHVEGGLYRNNDISQVRLGSPGSTVKGAKVVVDDPAPEHDNSRGIRVSDGPGPVTITDCDVVMERGKGGGGVVGAYSGGSFDLRDSRVYVGPEYSVIGSDGEATSFAVYVDEPTGIDDGGSITIENTAITGGGSYRGAAIFRRDDVTVRNSCIHQTGTERDGLVFTERAPGSEVVDTTINVPGQMLVSAGELEVSGLDAKGTCPVPGSSDSGDDAEETKPETEPPQETQSQPPIPYDTDDFAYGVMGTDPDNPTATVYGNYKCPYTQQFVTGNLETIRQEFVETGELNVRYRDVAYHPTNPGEPYLLDEPQNELVSQVGLGVWNVEPESYWQFHEYVFENQSDVDWTSLDSLTNAMQEAGVRNWGKIRVFVDVNMYEQPVHETTTAAQRHDVSFVPQLELAGDTTAPHHATDAVLDWIEARL